METTTMTLEERIVFKGRLKCCIFKQDYNKSVDYTSISFDEEYIYINGALCVKFIYYKDIFVDYKKWKLTQ